MECPTPPFPLEASPPQRSAQTAMTIPRDGHCWRSYRGLSRAAARLLPGAVSVQVMKTSFLRARLHMAYPTTMETLAALPPDIWARTPPEAQAYIRVLEVRVAALESEMQALHAQLQQTSQNSSRPPSSDPPQHQRRRR